MKKNNQLGVIGGVMIALAALLTGTGFDFSSSNLKDPMLLVLFASGVGVVVFILMGNWRWASHSTIAAATIALIWILSLFMNGGSDLSVRLVILVIGVILAWMVTVGRRR